MFRTFDAEGSIFGAVCSFASVETHGGFWVFTWAHFVSIAEQTSDVTRHQTAPSYFTLIWKNKCGWLEPQQEGAVGECKVGRLMSFAFWPPRQGTKQATCLSFTAGLEPLERVEDVITCNPSTPLYIHIYIYIYTYGFWQKDFGFTSALLRRSLVDVLTNLHGTFETKFCSPGALGGMNFWCNKIPPERSSVQLGQFNLVSIKPL